MPKLKTTIGPIPEVVTCPSCRAENGGKEIFNGSAMLGLICDSSDAEPLNHTWTVGDGRALLNDARLAHEMRSALRQTVTRLVELHEKCSDGWANCKCAVARAIRAAEPYLED